MIRLGISDPVRCPKWCLDRSLQTFYLAFYGAHRFIDTLKS